MKRYNKWATAGVALSILGVLAGCGTANNGINSATNEVNTVTNTIGANNTATSTPANTLTNNTPTTNAANSTSTPSTTNATNQVTSKTTSHLVFYIKFPPNTTLPLSGGGPGGNSAPLGTLKSGSTGWVKSPYQPGWGYVIGSGNSQVVIDNQTFGPQLSGIPNNTSYTIKGHPTNSTKSDTNITSGTTSSNGEVPIPNKPGWDITIQYPLQGATHSVQIRIPSQ